MGKDKNGRFHPPKGKPSAAGRKKGATETVKEKILNPEQGLEEKYAIDPDSEEVGNVHVQHPNRNADKRTERTQSRSVQKARNTKPTSQQNEQQFFKQEGQNEFAPLSISLDALRELDTLTGNVCISIYFRRAMLNDENNSMIKQVATELRTLGIDDSAISRSLKGFFLNGKVDTISGGALFIADSFYRCIELPAPPDQMVFVQKAFVIGPLVPFIFDREYFYLLVISKKQSKLFLADAFSMKPVTIPEMPNGMADVVHFEEKEDQQGAREKRPDEKEFISQYLAEVDNTIWRAVLHQENVPLVVAGVDYLISIFKKITRYNHVWDKAITGSLEYENEQLLYPLARKTVEAYFEEKIQKALAEYGDKSATSLTTSLADHLIPAAYFGRISKLLVQASAQLWGTFDETTGVVSLHEQREENDDDLVDRTVAKTLLNGGEVLFIDAEKMPFGNQLAAILRY